MGITTLQQYRLQGFEYKKHLVPQLQHVQWNYKNKVLHNSLQLFKSKSYILYYNNLVTPLFP